MIFTFILRVRSGGPERYISRFQDNKADVAFKSSVIAKKTLMAGFTTVRDVGGSGVNISLRNAINSGVVPGPRIFTSGKTIALLVVMAIGQMVLEMILLMIQVLSREL